MQIKQQVFYYILNSNVKSSTECERMEKQDIGIGKERIGDRLSNADYLYYPGVYVHNRIFRPDL